MRKEDKLKLKQEKDETRALARKEKDPIVVRSKSLTVPLFRDFLI